MDWAFFESKYPLIMTSLKNAKEAGRLAHAHLVVTANPDFRLAFPPVLAALAACNTPKPDFSPCGKCNSCTQIMSGIYPDTYTLTPTSKSREIVIGKDSDEPDTLRWFEGLFHLSSLTESGWKIGVVQEADTMNESAQNAFLKTLEEPPKNCIFILTTGRAADLLPTIRSRCQMIALTDNKCEYRFPGSETVPGILMNLQFRGKGNIVAGEDCAKDLINLAGSLYDEAVRMIEEKWASRLEAASNLENAGVKLLEKRIDGESGCEYRRMREQFISLIHSWFAQVALLTSGMDKATLPNPEIMEPLLKEKTLKITEQTAYRDLARAEKLINAMRTNVNDELAIRALCLNVALK